MMFHSKPFRADRAGERSRRILSSSVLTCRIKCSCIGSRYIWVGSRCILEGSNLVSGERSACRTGGEKTWALTSSLTKPRFKKNQNQFKTKIKKHDKKTKSNPSQNRDQNLDQNQDQNKIKN